MKKSFLILLLGVSVMAMLMDSCKKEPNNGGNGNTGNNGSNDTTTMVEMTPYELAPPNSYFPKVEIPEDNKMYKERIALGKQLFLDTRLSNNGDNCAKCHKPEYGFSSPGTSDQDKGLVALPLINLVYNKNFMWANRITGTLEDVMYSELENRFHTDVNKINAINEYRISFKNFYGVDTIDYNIMAKALAQYMRVLVSGNTKYDRWLLGTATLTPLEEMGRDIFFTEKGDCFHCHTQVIFTDDMVHNNGLDSVYPKYIDLGYYNVTGDPNDKGKFKAPNLRNVALRTNYMHDGRFTTLMEVVNFYDTGVKKVPNVDPVMTKPNRDAVFGLGLDEGQKKALIAFLHTLTDSTMINNPDFQEN